MSTSQSRRQRRSYEKILKKMDPASYKEFKKDSQERGKEIHRQNIQAQLRSEDEVISKDTETEIIDVQETK